MRKITPVCLVVFLLVPSLVLAQAPDYSGLTVKIYDPAVDPDPDMFMGSWYESMPRVSHGSLVERDIFTKFEGTNPIRPHTRRAVLTDIKSFSHATLQARNSTTPTILKGEQEIFYIDAGKGIITAGAQTAEMNPGVGILIPEGLEFTMTNTEDEPLTMYVIVEWVTRNFKPRKDMLVRDEHTMPIESGTGHWCHIFKRLFRKDDGLSIITGMGPVWFDPMTMGQPHSHGEGSEEIWFVLEGNVEVLLGKQTRTLSPGSAYKIPPNGTTPHSNINGTYKPMKLFWFMVTPESKVN